MPFKSEKQKRYMFSQHPDIANRWVAEEKAKAKKEKRMPKYVVAKSAFGIEHAEVIEDVSKAGLTPIFRLGATGTKEANAAAGGVRAATGAKDMSSVDTSAKAIMNSVRRAKAGKTPQPQKPPGSDLVPVGGARTKAEPIQRKASKAPGKDVVPVGKPYTPASKDLVPAASRSVAPTAGRGEVIQGRVVGRNQGPRKPYEQGPQKVRRQFKLDVKNPFAGKQIKNPLSGKFKLKTKSGTSAPKSFKDTKANSVDAALIGGGLVGASVLGASAMNNRNKVSKRYLTYSNNDWR